MAFKDGMKKIADKIKAIFGKDAKKKIASATLGAAVGIGATIATAPKKPEVSDKPEKPAITVDMEPEVGEETTEFKYGTSKYVIISDVGARLRSSAGIKDDNVVGKVNYDDVVLIDNDTIYVSVDGHMWGQVIEINDVNSENMYSNICYVALDDDIAKRIDIEQSRDERDSNATAQVNTGGIGQYQEVEITEKDMNDLLNFTNSWENQALYAYKTKTPGYTYDNPYICEHITEDGQSYKCYEDGDINYGFGVMVYGNYNNSINVEHKAAFEKQGYDITSPWFINNCLIGGESTMPVSVIDEVSKEYLRGCVDNVKAYLKECDVNFSKHEIIALSAMSYQYGKGDSFVHKFIDDYIKHGGDVEAFMNNFETYNGSKVFNYVPGGTATYKGEVINRAYAYRKAFGDGIFPMGSGIVEDITISDIQINDMQQSGQDGFARNEDTSRSNAHDDR